MTKDNPNTSEIKGMKTSIQSLMREAMTNVACADACLLGREGVSDAMDYHRQAIRSLQLALGMTS